MADVAPSFAVRDSDETPADFYLRGATDDTRIGNMGDALKFMVQNQTVKTYTASITNLSVANNATDIFTIEGSANRRIKVRSIFVSATRQNSGLIDLLGIKRSTLNSGGTSTVLSAVAHDSANAASAVTVRAYTANPTSLGTSVGVVLTQKFFVPSANNSSAGQLSVLSTSVVEGQPLTINNENESLSVNLNSQTIAGNLFNIYITWTEETV